MLVLRRKVGQMIVIADDLRITICAIQGGQVKIGIEAPADVPIVRSELLLPREQQTLPLAGLTHKA